MSKKRTTTLVISDKSKVWTFFEKHGEPSLRTINALIEGERSGTSNKKVKDIISSAKKKLKNG
jgi:hypothetical protein